MKVYNVFVLFIAGLLLMYGCGKPQQAESLTPDDLSGGYTIVKVYPTSAYAQDLIKKDSLLYIAQGEGGMTIINVKEPEDPQTVSITTGDIRGYCAKITMKDSVVYLAAGTFGLNVVDVSDPLEPVVTVSNLSLKPARDIHVMGDYLFTAISEQGVRIAEIGYPTQPDPRGGLYTSGYAKGLTTSADSAFLFVACGEMGLSIFDISDFQEGFGEYPLAGWSDTPGYAESVILLEDESLAFMACGTAGLQIIDYADTANCVVVGSYDGPGYAKELAYYDHKIFMAAEKGGLQIIDVSDVTNPVLKGLVETEYALGLVVEEDESGEGYIYVADDSNGLVVVKFPGPTAIE